MGPSIPHAQSTAHVLQDYARYLPSVLQATAGQQTNLANAQLGATQATQPGYNALNLAQLQQFGVPLAQAGQAVTNSNALAGAQTNYNQLTGPGGAAASAANALNRSLNPEYFGSIGAASRGAQDTIGAINLHGLSPGEQSAVERSLNQTNSVNGNLGLNNATNIVSNAMNFGGAFNNKLGLMNNAVNTATGVANTASGNGGFNPVNVALGQPNQAAMGNFGTGTYTGTNAGTQAANSSNNLGFGQALTGQMQTGNSAIVGANAAYNSINAAMGSMPSYS